MVDLVTNDLVYDPFSQRIYASVPSAGGPELGNSIATIDPVTGLVENSVFIGSEPGPLAISDDGQFIYAGLDGAASVRRYHIPTASAGLQIYLGSDDFYGPYYAEDIEVLPGNPNSIAVARKNLCRSPRHAGVAIYDDGGMRPNTTQRHTGSNRIEFSEFSSVLYGYNNETTEFGFRQIEVAEDGATQTALQKSMITGFRHDIEFEAGVVYATSGIAVNPVAMVPIGIFNASGPVSANAYSGEVFFIHGTTFKTFDMDTFWQTDSVEIPEIVGSAGSLIGWGENNLAFRTSSGQVFLITRSSSMPAPPPAPEPDPDPEPDPEPDPDPPVSSNLICDVEMSKDVYAHGEDVYASRVRIANLSEGFVLAEGKFWFSHQTGEDVPVTKFDSDGLFNLPAGFDKDFGPIKLTSRTTKLQPGIHKLNCRIINAVTGAQYTTDTEQFEISESSQTTETTDTTESTEEPIRTRWSR